MLTKRRLKQYHHDLQWFMRGGFAAAWLLHDISFLAFVSATVLLAIATSIWMAWINTDSVLPD